MKLTSYLYIFALAVLCSPGFFIKNKPTQNILYSLIFTVLLYITFDFVNKYTENYEQYNVDVKGVDSLVNLIKTQSGGNDSKKIDINNQLFQEAGANDANCWNALGKNQKELEIIKVQLDSYAGSKESIDKLNTQLDSQKQEVEKLQDGLKGFEGTKTEIDQINIQIKKYQTEIDKLKQQLVLYNQTEKTIGEINNQISKVQTVITDLNTKISECNTLNSGKEENIATLTGNIREQGTVISTLETRKTNLTNEISSQNSSISSLNARKSNLTNDIPSQNNTINSLRSRINSREGCGERLKLTFVTGGGHSATDKINEMYLTYNNNRVTNIANLYGQNYYASTEYSVELTLYRSNTLINGFYIDVGNDGTTISTIAMEILVNGNWNRITFADGKDHYNLPSNWIKNRSEQFRFTTVSISPSIWYLNPSIMSQNDHQNTARRHGGNLASFHSADELNRIISKFNNSAGCWIGGKRKGTNWYGWTRIFRGRIGNSSEWEWYDGSSWDYTNWHPGEPNNYSETALQLYPGGTWNDAQQGHGLQGLYKMRTPYIGIPGLIKIIV